ncbi:MAG: hypothetical protein ABTD50_22890 [Polyangiaceae bacterium]|jgi:hypothetical protein
MTAAVDRVLHLITLATDISASENEARNAAVAACRLIRENGFQVVTGTASDDESPDMRAARVAWAAAKMTCPVCCVPLIFGEDMVIVARRYTHAACASTPVAACACCLEFIPPGERTLEFGVGQVHKSCVGKPKVKRPPVCIFCQETVMQDDGMWNCDSMFVHKTCEARAEATREVLRAQWVADEAKRKAKAERKAARNKAKAKD